MNSNHTRRTLIKRVQDQQDETSWEEFVQVYQHFIYAIIRKLGINEHDADDLLQQVLLYLWKMLPDLDLNNIRRFRTVLSNVTKHRTIDFIRKRSNQAKCMEKVAKDKTLQYLHEVKLDGIDEIADREWEIHLTNLAVEKIKSRFSGQAINVFKMNVTGSSIKEIAQKLNLQENSVYRLRNRVKACLITEISQLRQELE